MTRVSHRDPPAQARGRARARSPRYPRRGLALLAALWLVILITSVGASLAAAASAHRAVGLTVADRARDRAVLTGALAILQARLEAMTPSATDRRRLGPPDVDPWRNLPRMRDALIVVGRDTVTLSFIDLGTVRNLNLASEAELTRLAAHVLGDLPRAQRVAQAVLDWRDADDLPRALGAETDAYREAGRVVQPANAPFTHVDELRHVLGVDAETLDALRPFLTTRGQVQRVNLNVAPEAVLRTLPSLSEPVLRQLLALRAAGRRVESVPGLFAAFGTAGRAGDGAGAAQAAAMVRALQETTALATTDVLVTLRVRARAPAPAAQLSAVLQRDAEGMVRVSERQW
jgi:general secretion pathway protein K